MPKRSNRVKGKNGKKKGQKPNNKPAISDQRSVQDTRDKSAKLKKLFKWLGTNKAFIVAMVALTISYFALIHPRISVSIGQNTPKISDAYFTFTNEGYFFTLYDATARLSTDRIEAPNSTIRDITMEIPMSKLGNITPKNSSTFPLSKIVDLGDWEKGSICLVVDFTIKLFWGAKKLSKTQTFGFYSEKKARINEWIQRPCNQLQSS